MKKLESKVNTLEDKLSDNKIRCYRHVLRMNKEKIPNKVLNMRVKGKCPREGPRSRQEQGLSTVTQMEEKNTVQRN
jgi:hypothetical protein